MAFISDFLILVILSGLFYVSFSNPICQMEFPGHPLAVYKEDVELLQFSLNLEFLEAEFFSWSAKGYGLDVTAPQLVMGGPPPIGGQKANLDFVTHNIINEFANQEIGHIRAIFYTVGGFPRPFMDISAENFAKFFDEAFGYKLEPPFDPYRDSLSYMLSCYVLPYVGLNGYVAANPFINGYKSKRVLAGLLGPEAGQDAVCRTYLYERADEIVFPYPYTVAEFTARISGLRNRLGMCGIKDEGLFVPPQLGAENRTTSNILSADYFSLSYPRTPAEILRIVYDTGNEHVPGGFFPADDLIMCYRADKISIQLLLDKFNHFSRVIGLNANLEKSSIYVAGVSLDFKEMICSKFQFKMETLPFKYLGVPLSSRKLVHQCLPLVERITNRIKCWT